MAKSSSSFVACYWLILVFALGVFGIGYLNLRNAASRVNFVYYNEANSAKGWVGAYQLDAADMNALEQTTPKPFSRDVIQEERQKRLQDYCALHKTEMSFNKPRKLVSFNGSVMYCRINKCASTFTLETLRKIFPCNNCRDPMTVFKASHKSDVKKSIMGNFSFFFVREPYRRLFSTYSNKFYLPKEYWAPVGPMVVQKYRLFPSKDSLMYGHDITFLEMIRYTVDSFENNRKLDVHLRPLHRLCNPCRFNYTYIGTLETLNKDWENMYGHWKRAGVLNRSSNATVEDIYFKSNLPELYHFFQTKNMLADSSIPMFNLYLRTWTYYQITGRIAKNMSMPFTKVNIDDVTYDVFYREVSTAIKKSTTFGKEVKAQKDDALKQAYATIPKELLERLRNVVLHDCLMFGYDDRPDWLFNGSLREFVPDFDYFPGI